jgi:hypothetical protein
MVQELTPGGGESQFSYGALCQEGRPIASVMARRTRQYPVDFGRSSSYVELIEEPEVELVARRLVEDMGYTGLIEAEFKRDRRDGKLKLLDLNPHVWGWHTLSVGAGVDFPYLFWRLARTAYSRNSRRHRCSMGADGYRYTGSLGRAAVWPSDVSRLFEIAASPASIRGFRSRRSRTRVARSSALMLVEMVGTAHRACANPGARTGAACRRNRIGKSFVAGVSVQSIYPP